jgi:hypothetical protein
MCEKSSTKGKRLATTSTGGEKGGKGKRKNREKRNEIEKDGKLKFELCV